MRATDRFLTDHGLSIPIIQAPMAGSNDGALAAAVSSVGGLGSSPAPCFHPTGSLRRSPAFARDDNPFNPFFTHTDPVPDDDAQMRWRAPGALANPMAWIRTRPPTRPPVGLMTPPPVKLLKR